MTFADFAKDHQLTPAEQSELGYALAIIRKGCGTVSGKTFRNVELLEALRHEAFLQSQASAHVMAEILDCAHCKLLGFFIDEYEREKWRRSRNR